MSAYMVVNPVIVGLITVFPYLPDGKSFLRLNVSCLLNLFRRLSPYCRCLCSSIVVLHVIFFYFGFRLPLFPLLCFIMAVFVCFTVMFHWWCKAPYTDWAYICNLKLLRNELTATSWSLQLLFCRPFQSGFSLFLCSLQLYCLILSINQHPMFFRCFGKNVLRDWSLSWVTFCGTPWTFLLLFLLLSTWIWGVP